MIGSGIEADIVLDHESSVYTPGEIVTGVLSYTAAKPTKVKGVTVFAQWSTQGKGDTDRDRTEPVVLLGEDELLGDGEVPFQLTLPLAPLTYRGTLIKINWEVCARFNRPWAIDGKASTGIEVV